MSRRGGPAISARGGGGGRGGAGDARGDAAKRQLEKLREKLLQSLHDTLNDTVETVCEEFEESFAQATQSLPAAPPSLKPHANGRSKLHAHSESDPAGGDYELFYSQCRRLVTYISANMATSPDFAQQMDRIILACHSNASETVLRTVVKKSIWFHRKDGAAVDTGDDDEDEDEVEGEDDVVELRVKPSRAKGAQPPPRQAAKTMQAASRGVKRRAPPPPPPPPAPRSAKTKSPVKKRARKDVAIRGSRYAHSEDSEEESQAEERVELKPKRRVTRIRYSDNEEAASAHDDEEDGEDVVLINNDAPSQPHYGQADELLKFKDAIGDMCYAERRTPAQTRFFKERLRKAIQFVDAQLCKPPKGKVCGWECAKIRRQMCNRDLPCRNKICRLWHDVEAHTDRCQNTHCEFRIRVMLRETMYKIEHKKMELAAYRNEMYGKKKELLDLKHDSLPDRENMVERRLLDNEIDQLEADIEAGEKDLGVFKATKKAYWATLNEIGVTVDDDDNDQFQKFDAHYADRKPPAPKKKTPTKAHQEEDEQTPPPRTRSAPSSAARSERSRRRESSTPTKDTNVYLSPVATARPPREKITRRSTQQSLQVMTNGVIELDDDDDDEEEETKTDRSVEEDDNGASRRRMDGQDESKSDTEPAADEPSEESSAALNSTRKSEGDHDAGDGPTGDPQAAEKQPQASSATIDDVQSADYVLESDEIQTPADKTTEPHKPASSSTDASVKDTASMQSALAAFNQVVDSAHSAPQELNQPAEENGAAPPATEEEDNAPLLPF